MKAKIVYDDVVIVLTKAEAEFIRNVHYSISTPGGKDQTSYEFFKMIHKVVPTLAMSVLKTGDTGWPTIFKDAE